MRLETQVKQNSHCAIFSRNYSEHLDEAVEISNQNPRQPITFRSSVIWSSAKKAIKTHGQRKIYFATVGDSNLVRYEGNLEQVELNPELNLQTAQDLLQYCIKSTKEEGLWEEVGKVKVKTLYVISNCRNLSSPFPFTHLRKLLDGSPIDDNFSYGYALVYER
ncbi:hypothetical protein H6G97_06615 [Nostoc flagelliforme FACHB-838]|uniref:Uncharacterized protein n=1 Tax=Nostoc flagelliforme FACHB-838 TaxID=2692904 RepID=A0ABR8DIB7_9NOSO|nr:hypothetical protein [Nostoc flagelliforme]MBD2529262.1 hypothetical protein [Nostoc flagelliforme FACHB-838]